MGWGTFLIAYATLAVTVFCPGYLALRALHAGRHESLCLAPSVTVVIIIILGIVYASLGVNAGYLSLVAAPTAALLVLCLLRRPWRASQPADRSLSWLPVTVYAIVGIGLTLMFFAGNLEGNLAAFQPDNDNSFHLSLIKSIADSGEYSILRASVYRASQVAPFAGGGSFYPAAFHCLAASVVSLLGLSVSLVENALAAVIVSLVWPLGAYWLLSRIFPRDEIALYAGSLACMLVIAFPWRFITWGPLFPNMLSLALVPGAAATFMEAVESVGTHQRSSLLLRVALFVLSVVAIGTAHPNGVFTLGVILVPYIVSAIWSAPERGKHTTASGRAWLPRLGLTLIFLLLVAGIWVLAYSLPALKSVVDFVWDPYEDFGLGLLGAITLKTAGNRSQSLMAVLLVVGLVGSLRDWRHHAWLFALFAFVALQFAVSASLTGPVRQLLCGFWYTDPNRLAANVALAAVPLVSLGISQAMCLLSRVLGAERTPSGQTLAGLSITALGMLLVTSLLGHSSEEMRGFQLSTTASFDYSQMLEYKYSSTSEKGYDTEEQAFVDKVLETVPEGSLLLNLPNDGSCFAYALQDANVYYKDVTSPSIGNLGQTPEALIIRRNLYHLSDYQSVRDAVSTLGAHYLLVLDKGLGQEDANRSLPTYHSREWRGIVSVDDDTPGFEVVLSEGDMRLYRLAY